MPHKRPCPAESILGKDQGSAGDPTTVRPLPRSRFVSLPLSGGGRGGGGNADARVRVHAWHPPPPPPPPKGGGGGWSPLRGGPGFSCPFGSPDKNPRPGG